MEQKVFNIKIYRIITKQNTIKISHTVYWITNKHKHSPTNKISVYLSTFLMLL